MLARLFILLQLQMVALEKGSSADNPAYYNIGGVLTTNASLEHFSTTIAVSKRYLCSTIVSTTKNNVGNILFFLVDIARSLLNFLCTLILLVCITLQRNTCYI